MHHNMVLGSLLMWEKFGPINPSNKFHDKKMIFLSTTTTVDLWDQETFLDNLQIEHRYTNGGAAAEIVAILEEAREGREERKR